MNEADSEVVAAILATDGYQMAEDISEADLVLLNTCSVRDNAEQKVLSFIKELQASQQRNGKPFIGVIGCMAERLQDELFNQYGVNLVAGPDNYNDLPLFEEADETCAVANARDEVKAAADHVIGANTEDGVALWILENWHA